jgi:hypothetical protein
MVQTIPASVRTIVQEKATASKRKYKKSYFTFEWNPDDKRLADRLETLGFPRDFAQRVDEGRAEGSDVLQVLDNLLDAIERGDVLLTEPKKKA